MLARINDYHYCLDPKAFWRWTIVNLQELGASLTANLGTASQDGFASRRGRGRPGRIDQAEEEREEVTDDAGCQAEHRTGGQGVPAGLSQLVRTLRYTGILVHH